MKNINKTLIMLSLLFAGNSFADDIWFISPTPGQTVQGKVQIQIQAPYQDVNVRLWIEEENRNDRVVWRGSLSKGNNYTITVDTSKFRHGPYEIKAKYYIGREDYDGDVDIWVGNPASPDGEYFPQQ